MNEKEDERPALKRNATRRRRVAHAFIGSTSSFLSTRPTSFQPSSSSSSTCVRSAPCKRARHPMRCMFGNGNGDGKKGEEEDDDDDAQVRDLLKRASGLDGQTEVEKRNETIDILNTVSTLHVDAPITRIYTSLRCRGMLPGFGRWRPVTDSTTAGIRSRLLSPSLQEKAEIAANLPTLTGLPLSALTPNKARFSGWLQLVPVCTVWFLLYLVRIYSPYLNEHVTLKYVAYTVAGIVSLDQLALNGIISEHVLKTRAQRERHELRIATHEAGHLLLAYVHGLPVQKYTLSAFDALLARVPGQAATLFADDELSMQLGRGRLSVGVVDRYAVVAMAGVAAEGLVYGEAIGGDADVGGLIALLTGLKPAWEEREIRILARWAVVKAVGIIKTQRLAYEALKMAMLQRKPLGECVLVIEDHLTRDEEDVKMDKERERELNIEERERNIENKLNEIDRKTSQLDQEKG